MGLRSFGILDIFIGTSYVCSEKFDFMSPIKTFLIAFSLGVVITIGNTSVFAAELFRKQTGTATIAAGAASVAVTIPAVCMTQSFLVFQ